MKELMKYTLLLITLLTYINANNLNDKAFNAYKNRDYKSALKIYLKSAKANNKKALLMIALFYEKGLGVKKDKYRAIKIYKNILKRTSNIKRLVENRDFKKLNVTIAALERLYALTDNKNYSQLANKFKALTNIKQKETKELFSVQNIEDDYLVLCPGAEVVAPEDREGIEDFDCALFEHFPKKMAQFMHLRRLRFKSLELPKNIRGKYLSKIDAKIAILITPMIEYLQKEVVTCYANAIDMNDIRSCDYDYLLKTDPMLFKSDSYKLEQYVLKHNLENHELEPYEKEDLVDKLIDKIVKKNYGKNWKDMVK